MTGHSKTTGVRIGWQHAAFIAAAAMLVVSASGRERQIQSSSADAKGIVVLFSGKEDEVGKNWTNRAGSPAAWKLVDGAMQARGGDIISKEKFTDYQLHV